MILTLHPEARDCDETLYIMYCDSINPTYCNLTRREFAQQRAFLGLPTIESVGRARRKLQEKRPDLRASKEATDKRYEEWKEVREYVKNE